MNENQRHCDLCGRLVSLDQGCRSPHCRRNNLSQAEIHFHAMVALADCHEDADAIAWLDEHIAAETVLLRSSAGKQSAISRLRELRA